MRNLAPCSLLVSLALAACAGPHGSRARMTRLLAEAPEGTPVRLQLQDDRIVAAAVPVGPGEVPAAARQMFDAIAPGGRVEFVGREWGERGDGYRVVKVYDGTPVRRSVLVTRDGEVLERWHAVPLRPGDMPAEVLAGITTLHTMVDEARIVSGREREEYWDFLARDRIGRQYVVRLGLDGRHRATMRRLAASIDA